MRKRLRPLLFRNGEYCAQREFVAEKSIPPLQRNGGMVIIDPKIGNLELARQGEVHRTRLNWHNRQDRVGTVCSLGQTLAVKTGEEAGP